MRVRSVVGFMVLTFAAARAEAQCSIDSVGSVVAGEIARLVTAFEQQRGDAARNAGVVIEVVKGELSAPKPSGMDNSVWQAFVRNVSASPCVTDSKMRSSLNASLPREGVSVVAGSKLNVVKDHYAAVRKILLDADGGGSIQGLDPETVNELQLHDINYVVQVRPQYTLEADDDIYAGSYSLIAAADVELLSIERATLRASAVSARTVQSFEPKRSVTLSATDPEPFYGEVEGQGTIWNGPLRDLTVEIEVSEAPLCARRFDVALTSSSLRAFSCSQTNGGFCNNRKQIGYSQDGQCIAPGRSLEFTFKFPPWLPSPPPRLFEYATVWYEGLDELDDASF